MQLSAQFSAIATRQAVDRAAGIIRGVSIITEGEATGHGLRIDGTTLQQVLDTAKGYAGGLKVKVNHGTSLESIVGAFKDFVLDGDRVRADLHLFKTADLREKVLEMAESIPESFGVSVSIANQAEEIAGQKFIRCAEIYSADLVDSPAANPGGLFSKPNTQIMTEPNPQATELATLAAQVVELKKVVDGFKPTDLSAVTAEITAAKTELGKLTTAAAEAAKQAKETQVAALVAEAGRDGKVIPLTDVQLSKMDVADIKEMITKLPKGQISLYRKNKPEALKDESGAELCLANLRTAEGRLDLSKTAKVNQALRDRQIAGAFEIDAAIRGN